MIKFILGIKGELSCVFLFFCLSVNASAQTYGKCTFVEKGGVVIVEMESGDYNGTSWVMGNSIPGYAGSGYLEYTGTMITGIPGRSMLSYKIQISEPGLYSFKARGYRYNFDANDVWVRFPQGGAITKKGDDSTSYLNDSWFKYFLGARDQWNYFMKTQIDGYAHLEFMDVYVNFPEAGTYTVEFSGRSTGFILDRFSLYKTSGYFGMDPFRPEAEKSDCETVVVSRPYQTAHLQDQTFLAEYPVSFGFSDTIFKHTDSKSIHYNVYLRGNDPLPSWLSYDKVTRTFSGTPAITDTGKYHIIVKAQDLDQAYVLDEFILNIKSTDTIETVQGLKTLRDVSGMELYPNPVVSEIHFKASDNQKYSLEVIDVTGNSVLSINTVLNGNKLPQMEALQEGLYLVNLFSEEGQYLKSIRLIKK